MKAFELLKKSVFATTEERDSLPKDSLFYPSEIWKEANKLFSFLKYLPEHELESMRIHTTSMTGSPFLEFTAHPKRNIPDDEKLNYWWAASHYKKSTEYLPPKYHISEPTPNKLTADICLPFRNKLLTNDLVRYQRFIANLYNLGIINTLNKNESNIVLEIGGGYGALAYHLNKMINKNSYIIVDTPEILFWAGAYLTVNNPEAKIFIYDKDLHKSRLTKEEIESYDFLLIPNYKLLDLIGDIEIDLAINMLSLQEMTEAQIRFYCDYISRNLKGYFGSDNMDVHPINKELSVNVDSIFREYFKLFPSEIDFQKLVRGNSSFTPELWQVYSFFGISKESTAKIDFINPLIIGVNYDFKFKEVSFFDSVIIEEEKKVELKSKQKSKLRLAFRNLKRKLRPKKI